MAQAKTSPFYLTADVTLTAANTAVQATIPLGSYIDVASKQAIAILEVDYGTVEAAGFTSNLGGDLIVDYQTTDINRGALVSATDTAVISRGALLYENAAPISATNMNHLYPDSFGSLEEARMVVNDDIFFLAQSTNVPVNLQCTIRIKAQVIKLSEKDFMSLALTSVGSA
tara:strand:- start:350 stop:862 length:513 start_codon:yes stop_codon:yes gene_type:complete